MRKAFDPLEYIESAFIDKNDSATNPKVDMKLDVDLPTIGTYLGKSPSDEEPHAGNGVATLPKKFRKTQMSAPRPRKNSRATKRSKPINPELQAAWEALPKNMEFLMKFYDDGVTANYYTGDFRETREDLMMRLLDPQLSLEEVARLLGVCPATIRRYTNKGWLNHHRTQGGQRRFRLTDVIKFVEEHGRFPEA